MIIKREKFPQPPFPVLRRIRRGESKGGRGGINSEEGFSLVELIITMAVFVLVIAAASGVFTGLLTQFKQQSKIAETNIEGIVGLEILRRDIEHAGYGLPWDLNGATYLEANNDAATAHDDTTYNDSTANLPRAILSGNGAGINGSDVLVVKAVNVATNEASSKWTHLFTGNTVTEWTPATERLETSDRVVVLRPGTTRTLVVNGGSFTTRYAENGAAADNLVDAGFAPPDNTETYVVYGVTLPASPVTTALRMPFNRADYYVRTPATNMPQRCAIDTGILYKATVNQGDGGLSELPLLDCVADMKVVFGLDTDATPDDVINCYVNNLADSLATVDAENIRNRVKEVRVYILAHEGQIDRAFTFTPPIPASSIRVGESSAVLPGGSCTGVTVLGQDFDLSGITNWQNYRWKVYTLVVKPNNLM